MKLIEAVGPRPPGAKISLEPDSRLASSPMVPPSPFQYERTVSR